MGLAAPRLGPRELDVADVVLEVVLPAGLAGQNRQAIKRGIARRVADELKVWSVRTEWERHERASDATHERMDYRPEQGPALASRGRAEGEPPKHLLLCDAPSESALKFGEEVDERAWSGEHFGELEDQLIRGE